MFYCKKNRLNNQTNYEIMVYNYQWDKYNWYVKQKQNKKIIKGYYIRDEKIKFMNEKEISYDFNRKR